MGLRASILTALRESLADLPDDTSLSERKRAVAKLRGRFVDCTAHSRHCWEQARREYLMPFGYVPRGGAALAKTDVGRRLHLEHAGQGQLPGVERDLSGRAS